ncbi:neuropeptide FF receptor 1-like [Paramacrobiotus metropolitanus]|uniref:neuropeptide FF receptor 1-like n=1 Tax=Paramacrobiotus metropolitanus TaxID=2943436 RepID=UPI002445FB17|nr:neuropeptide FF receptor 1-like [Paramacrobiotus metropolitanus]
MISRWFDDDNITGMHCVNCTTTTASRWTFVPRFLLAINAITLLLNIGVLVPFVVCRHLRSCFAVYIITLLLANVVFCLTNNWMVIVDQTTPRWPLSEAACTLHMYTSWVFEGVTMHVHVLITLNRIWAVYFPHSYRSKHTVRAALLMVLLMFAYVHVVALPGVVLDAINHRTSEFCSLNTNELPLWTAVVMIVIYLGPIGFMGGAYPFLLMRYQHRRRVSIGPSLQRQWRQSLSEGHFNYRTTDHRRGFLVLTAMTISVVVCWTPLQAYFTVAVFINVDLPLLRQVAYGLYSVQGALDPVLIIMTMRDLRLTIKKQLCFPACFF